MKYSGWMSVYHDAETGNISFQGPFTSQAAAEGLQLPKNPLFPLRQRVGVFPFAWDAETGFSNGESL